MKCDLMALFAEATAFESPLVVGLDVHGDIGQMEVGGEKFVFDLMRDAVAFAHGTVAGHTDMQVGDADEAAFAHAAFFDIGNSFHGRGLLDDFANLLGRDLLVEDLPHGAS